jgi:hypothetical protein
MTTSATVEPAEQGVRTGRRVNPAIDGPRDNTVCFMLSDGEKLTVDRLAFCMNITRSGILANIVAEFVVSADGSRESRAAEKRLLAYLMECRKAVKKRGKMAEKFIVEPKQGVKT